MVVLSLLPFYQKYKRVSTVQPYQWWISWKEHWRLNSVMVKESIWNHVEMTLTVLSHAENFPPHRNVSIKFLLHYVFLFYKMYCDSLLKFFKELCNAFYLVFLLRLLSFLMLCWKARGSYFFNLFYRMLIKLIHSVFQITCLFYYFDLSLSIPYNKMALIVWSDTVQYMNCTLYFNPLLYA